MLFNCLLLALTLTVNVWPPLPGEIVGNSAVDLASSTLAASEAAAPDLLSFSKTVRPVTGLAVIALIVAYLLRRKGSTRLGSSTSRLQIVETLRLDPRRQLHLLRIDHQQLLVSVSEAGVAALSTLPDAHEEAPERCTTTCTPASSQLRANPAAAHQSQQHSQQHSKRHPARRFTSAVVAGGRDA